MNAIQPEFSGFPASEADTASESVTARFLRLSSQHGPLLPQNLIPTALGVSSARVTQFINAGRLHVVEVDGTKFVPVDEVARFQRNPGGRPRKLAA